MPQTEPPGYEELEQQLQRVPLTWLPGLLYTLVTVCVRQQIFQEGGLVRTVLRAKQKAEDEDARITNTSSAGEADRRGD